MPKKHNHEIVKSNAFPRYSESYIKLSKERNIFLMEDVTKHTASDIAAWLLYYDNLDHEDPITIYISSNGGESAGLVHMYDVMQMIQAPIRTICMGKAYSAGAILLATGSTGERYAMKNSEIMIHGLQGIFPLPGLDVSESKNYYDFLNDHNDSIMKILAIHTKQPLDKIKKDCLNDIYMTASQALEYGIIDHII